MEVRLGTEPDGLVNVPGGFAIVTPTLPDGPYGSVILTERSAR